MVGEVFNTYIIVEARDKMIVIDKHAAHERIIFENLRAAMRKVKTSSQLLMVPVEVMMTSDEVETIKEYAKEIEACGFEFTAGRHTVSVTSIPEGISTDAVGDMLSVIAEKVKTGTGSAKLTRDILFEKALYQASCKAAVKAGREYPAGQVKWIADCLMSNPEILFCPHGRPVAVEISKKQLDRQVERPDAN